MYHFRGGKKGTSFTMIQGSIQQEDTTVINLYAPNNMSKNIKPTQRWKNKSTVIGKADPNFPHLSKSVETGKICPT